MLALGTLSLVINHDWNSLLWCLIIFEIAAIPSVTGYYDGVIPILIKLFIVSAFYFYLKNIYQNTNYVKYIYLVILLIAIITVINPFYELYPGRNNGIRFLLEYEIYRQRLGFPSAISLGILLLIGVALISKKNYYLYNKFLELTIVLSAIIFTQTTIAILVAIIIVFYKNRFAMLSLALLISIVGILFFLDDYNYGSLSARWNNVLSLINAIDFSFNGFMSLNFMEYKGILDQNDISFQLKLIFELGVIGVIFQLFIFIICLKKELIFPWFIVNIILLTADKFSDMWIIFLIFISLSKYCRHHIGRKTSPQYNILK